MSIPLLRRGAIVIVALALALVGSLQPLHRDARAALTNSPSLTIQYPSEGAALPFLTHDFVFGAAAPGASVRVNGVPALVAASGAWIAFVPMQPGAFQLLVVARTNGRTAQVVRTVRIGQPPRTLPATPAQVDAAVAVAPAEDLELAAGDTVHLFLKGTTGAHVTASLGSTASGVPLVETSVAALNPSDKDRALGDATAAGPDVGGLYVGELHIPAGAGGQQHVVYTLRARDGSTVSATAKGMVTIAALDSHRVGYITLPDRSKDIDARPYGIVESDPNGGWLFFPPAGTPFEVTGSAGDYYRVALGSAEQAWIAKNSLRLLEAGTPAPQAQVQDVIIADGVRAGTVMIHLTGRVPFRIDESLDGPALRVRLYGATAATDFIRYGDDRSNIRAVRWDQLAGGIATLDIGLRQHTLWGYHADWRGNDIKVVIKKPPVFQRAPAPALRGLLVVIDPGHSPDIGAIGPLGTQERDVNLAIAKRFAAHLQRLGARAVLTRTANVPVGLYDRTLLAARLGADILVSVHNNALPDGANPFTHHGYSVYYYQPQSLELARFVHAAYARHTSLADDGLYFDNLALARPTDQPAILTESAFIMWPPEEMLLRSAAFQDTLGATLADGLERWVQAIRTRELSH